MSKLMSLPRELRNAIYGILIRRIELGPTISRMNGSELQMICSLRRTARAICMEVDEQLQMTAILKFTTYEAVESLISRRAEQSFLRRIRVARFDLALCDLGRLLSVTHERVEWWRHGRDCALGDKGRELEIWRLRALRTMMVVVPDAAVVVGAESDGELYYVRVLQDARNFGSHNWTDGCVARCVRVTVGQAEERVLHVEHMDPDDPEYSILHPVEVWSENLDACERADRRQ